MDALPAKLSGETLTARGLLVALWGVVGIAVVLVHALWRLIPLAVAPLQAGQLSAGQAVLYAAWVIFTAYAEGYRGFQLRFAPSCVARALSLAQAPTLTLFRALLAPAYCMSLFAAPARRMLSSWLLVLGITWLVILVKLLPQPWRGIVDGGVVVGLSWGLLAIAGSAATRLQRALAGSS